MLLFVLSFSISGAMSLMLLPQRESLEQLLYCVLKALLGFERLSSRLLGNSNTRDIQHLGLAPGGAQEIR